MDIYFSGVLSAFSKTCIISANTIPVITMTGKVRRQYPSTKRDIKTRFVNIGFINIELSETRKPRRVNLHQSKISTCYIPVFVFVLIICFGVEAAFHLRDRSEQLWRNIIMRGASSKQKAETALGKISNSKHDFFISKKNGVQLDSILSYI